MPTLTLVNSADLIREWCLPPGSLRGALNSAKAVFDGNPLGGKLNGFLFLRAAPSAGDSGTVLSIGTRVPRQREK
jgi:hypothetical protein